MERTHRLYLIRHGQIDGYENFPVYGRTDVDLTETGVLQMERVAERLRFVDISAIFASDLKRSVIGARLMARYHDVPLYSFPQLREMDFGDWEGLTIAEISNRYPDELEKRQADLVNYQIPGNGETIARFSERIRNSLKGIMADHGGKDFMIVAHGGVNRIILCDALELDLGHMFNIQQDYGCLNIIDYFPDAKLVRLVNG